MRGGPDNNSNDRSSHQDPAPLNIWNDGALLLSLVLNEPRRTERARRDGPHSAAEEEKEPAAKGPLKTEWTPGDFVPVLASELHLDFTKILINPIQLRTRCRFECVLASHCICAVCHKIPLVPYTIAGCDCTTERCYCTNCLQQMAASSSSNPQCPFCRRKFYTSQMKTQSGYRGMLEMVKIKCRDCEWVGDVKTYKQEHLAKCWMGRVSCKFCLKRVRLDQRALHAETGKWGAYVHSMP